MRRLFLVLMIIVTLALCVGVACKPKLHFDSFDRERGGSEQGVENQGSESRSTSGSESGSDRGSSERESDEDEEEDD
jgi:hypothetical protein